MVDDVAPLIFGFFLGWLVARSHQSAPAPTHEHVIGSKIIAAARSAISQARFVGEEFAVFYTATFAVDDKEVEVRMVAKGADASTGDQA